MRRREIVAAGAVMALFGSSTAGARQAVQEWPLDEAFQGLASFLSLPLDQRRHFTLAYLVSAPGRQSETIPLFLDIPGKGRVAVPVTADGRLQRLPREEDFTARGSLAIEGEGREAVVLRTRILVSAGAEPNLEVRVLEAALAEANAWLAAAPLKGFEAKLAWVNFLNALGGVAVTADGVKTPLSINPRPVHYESGKHEGAVTVELQLPPSLVYLSEAGGTVPAGRGQRSG